MGERLASFLNERIDEQETEDRTREDIIAEMAEAADIEPGTVQQILDAEIDCPPRDRLEGFAEVLDTSVDAQIEAAEEDGCDYSADEDEEESGEEASACGCERRAERKRLAAILSSDAVTAENYRQAVAIACQTDVTPSAAIEILRAAPPSGRRSPLSAAMSGRGAAPITSPAGGAVKGPRAADLMKERFAAKN